MVVQATAKGHTMQALVKYHGLRDWDLRLPYHDSMSVNTDCLYTLATVEFGDLDRDTVFVDGKEADRRTYERVGAVLSAIRRLSGLTEAAMVRTRNNLPKGRGKGLGFSAAAGASIAAAAYEASGLTRKFGWDTKLLSRIARLFAGSSSRSVPGEYARWYSGTSDEDSYAVRVASRKDLDIAFGIIPIPLEISTEEVHREAESSSFFEARIASAQRRCDEVERAIKDGDYKRFFELVELDSLELHSVTMTGKSRTIIMTEDTVRIMRKVIDLRKKGTLVYYSFQTGPTVYLNTLPEYIDEVAEVFRNLGYEVITSRVGGGVELVQK
ncbi:MAG: hypothetical protein NZ920_00180 [Aigarchaeota archaeon]|nr:hypothetical protein [Aigarchaeota archaeon]